MTELQRSAIGQADSSRAISAQGRESPFAANVTCHGRSPISAALGDPRACYVNGLYAITSTSTFASTIKRASVVDRAGRPFGKQLM